MRDTSSCSSWEQIQRPIARQYVESEVLENCPKQDVSIKSFLLGLKEPAEEEVERA